MANETRGKFLPIQIIGCAELLTFRARGHRL
jgi:hypothetical protein